MRHVIPSLAGTLTILALASAGAQPARVGRLPVLAPPAARVGTCRNDPVNDELRHGGIERMVTYLAADSNSHRMVSLGMSATGRSVMLMAMMGTDEGRRGEGESVSAFFGPDGAIVQGRRRAFTTGTPSRLSEDRQLGLLADDTLAIHRLDAALRKRCNVS